MMLLLFACAPECTPGTKGCDVDPGADARGDSAVDSGSDTGPDSGDDSDGWDSDTGDSEAVPCTFTSTVTGVEEGPLGLPVNNRRVSVALDQADVVQMDCTLSSGPSADQVVFAAGSVWSYADTATVASGWSEVGFDDSGWATGAAPLGYGEAVATEVGYGGNPDDKYITSWYRSHFTVADPDALSGLRLNLTYDDGAVVTLNGVEAGRWNVPSGVLTPDTLATERVEPTSSELEIDAALLRAGDNVIAVELHQTSIDTTDAWIEVEIDADGPSSGDPDERFVVEAGPGTAVDIDLRGLLADSTYGCTVTPTCGAPTTVDVTTDPLPDAMPDLSITGAPPTPGYLLFNYQQPCLGSSQMYFVVIDAAGRVRWYHEAANVDGDQSMDIEIALIPGNRFLWAGGEDPDASPQIVDLDGTIVWTTSYPGAPDDLYHHDVEWTADGTVIGLVEASNTSGPRTFIGFDIVEQDPVTNEVLWRWSSQDAVDAGQLPPDGSLDPWHANALATVTDTEGPAVYVNLYLYGEVIRIDKATGDVTWGLGVGRDFALVDTSGAPLGDDGWFEAAHGLGLGDSTHLINYDNGFYSGTSRVVEYALDLPNRTATLMWTWGEGHYNPNWGDADLLPDGNVLVDEPATWCSGGDDSNGTFVIVDHDSGTVDWRASFVSVNDSSYRAEWIDACTLFGNQKYCPPGE